MKVHLNKYTFAAIVVIAILAFGAAAALAQTGFIDLGLFHRVHIAQDSTNYAGLTVVQQGDGHAISVLDTNSLEASYFDSDGSLAVTEITATSALTLSAGVKILPDGASYYDSGPPFVCQGSHDHTSTEDAVTICVIPANSNVVDVIYTVDTQWNDGTGAVSDCGISGGDLDAFVDNMNVNDAADFNRLGDAADMPYAASLVDVGASDATIVCQIAETDNDASAGAATLTIFYFTD